MPDPTVVEELRAASARLRKLADDDELYTAAGGSDFGPMPPDLARLVATVFDAWARMGDLDPDLLNRVGGQETLAVARAVNASKEQP
jgi:hypothetical protein